MGTSQINILDNRLIITNDYVHIIFKATVTFTTSDQPQKIRVPQEY